MKSKKTKKIDSSLVIKSKPNMVSIDEYSQLVLEVQKHIKTAQSNFIKTATRQKVVMAWNIGKSIDESLLRNKKSGYGEKLIEKLAVEILIDKKTLYRMRGFYQAYPTLPKDNDHLNWSHYQKLSGIKKEEERKRLEDLTKQNLWDARSLQQQVNQIKNNDDLNSKTKNKDEVGVIKTTKPITKKLRPERGQLYSYPILKFDELTSSKEFLSKKTYLDLGFNIFKEVEEVLPKAVQKYPYLGGFERKENDLNGHSQREGERASGAMGVQKIAAVDVSKENQKYSLSKSNIHPRKFNTYKAYLERVVDGDTIRVTIDLGFKILHKEIIRLKGIDAPEINSKEGRRSSKTLSKILKDIPFITIKTIKVDIYGRYVADVFFENIEEKTGKLNAAQSDPQKIADEGIYLNQVLLDAGVVQVFSE